MCSLDENLQRKDSERVLSFFNVLKNEIFLQNKSPIAQLPSHKTQSHKTMLQNVDKDSMFISMWHEKFQSTALRCKKRFEMTLSSTASAP
jgi:hypothetical protein